MRDDQQIQSPPFRVVINFAGHISETFFNHHLLITTGPCLNLACEDCLNGCPCSSRARPADFVGRSKRFPQRCSLGGSLFLVDLSGFHLCLFCLMWIWMVISKLVINLWVANLKLNQFVSCELEVAKFASICELRTWCCQVRTNLQVAKFASTCELRSWR